MTVETGAEHPTAEEPSVAELLTDLTDQLGRLIRAEMRLAVTEMRRKGKRAGLGAGMLGAAAICALAGIGALVTSAILGVALVLPNWLAALLVGVAVIVLGGLTALVGRSLVARATPPVPEWAASSVREDIETIKTEVRQR